MSARGAGASARTARHEDGRAEPDILFDTRRSGARSDAPSCGASLTETVISDLICDSHTLSICKNTSERWSLVNG